MWRWRRPDPEGLVEGEANSKVPPKLIYPSPARFKFRKHVVSKLAKQVVATSKGRTYINCANPTIKGSSDIGVIVFTVPAELI